MTPKVRQKLTRLTNAVPKIFANSDIENALNDARKASETICKLILLNGLGEAIGQAIIDGRIDHKKNPQPKPKKLDLNGLIVQVCRNDPADMVVIADYKAREKVKIYLESIRTHGNPASHDPDNARDVVTKRDCNYAKQALSQLLVWLHADFLKIQLPEVLDLCIKEAEGTDAILNAPSSPLMNFRDDLYEWFKSLGYGFDHLSIEDESKFQFIISFPERRKTTRVLIFGIVAEVRMQHYNEVNALYRHHDCDEGWIITLTSVSQSVQKRAAKGNVSCLNFDELIEQGIDLSNYFDWVRAEVAAKKIDAQYVPVDCERVEIDRNTKQFLAKEQYGEKDGFTEGYLDRWLSDQFSEHVSILGEFGTGKTWLTLHYSWRMIEAYEHAKHKKLPRPRIPILVNLRDFAKSVSVEALISDFFFRKHQVEVRGVFPAFMQLNKMGKLVLIFDGFDEMSDKVSKQKMIDNFWELARIITGKSKVILTCRTEHFPQIKEGRSLLNAELNDSTKQAVSKRARFEVLQLLKFSKKQIEHVLGFHTDRKTIKKIMSDKSIVDLLTRPIMTELILDALGDIQQGKPLDMARVYLYAMRRKMERDIDQARTFSSLADKLFFMSELSWKMLATETLRIHYKDFYELTDMLFQLGGNESHEIDYWRYDMRAQTLLIIDDEDGFYKPAHKSFLEFFVAFKFAAELGVLPADFTEVARNQSNIDLGRDSELATWRAYFRRDVSIDGTVTLRAPLKDFCAEEVSTLSTTVGRQPFTRIILDLLSSIISIDDLFVQDQLIATLDKCRGMTFDEVGYLPGNIVLLLANDRSEYFDERDLSGLCLRGVTAPPWLDRDHYRPHVVAHFRNTKLRHCDLSGADFGRPNDGSRTVRTQFGIDFTGSDLTNFRFQRGQLDSIATASGSNEIAIGGPDELVIVDKKTLTDVRVRRRSAWTVRFSPSGKVLACSGWGTVELFRRASVPQSVTHELSEQLNAKASEPRNLWAGAFDFSKDSKTLVIGCNNSFVYFLDLHSMMETRVLECFYGVDCVSLSPTGKYLLTSGFHEWILWDLRDNSRKLFEKRSKEALVRTKAIFQPHDDLFCVLTESKIRFLDADSLNVITELTPGGEVEEWEDLVFSKDGKLFACCTSTSIHLYQLQDGVVAALTKATWPFQGADELPKVEREARAPFQHDSLEFDEDGTFLFVLVNGKMVIKVTLLTWTIVGSFTRVLGVDGATLEEIRGVDAALMPHLLSNSLSSHDRLLA